MTKTKVNRPAGRHRKIAKRVYELARYERESEIAECMYGKEVADKLRELNPIDPMLLHDVVFFHILMMESLGKRLRASFSIMARKTGHMK